MNLKTMFLLTCILCFGFYSCTPPAPVVEEPPAIDMTKVKAEIQAMEDAYAAGLKAKDAEAVAVYYADDAVNMPSNEPVVVGKAAIINRLKEQMNKDTSNVVEKFELVDLKVAGDYIIEAGKSITTDPSGKKSTGKYVSIFEKRDGKYVCIRDIWNSDAKEEAN